MITTLDNSTTTLQSRELQSSSRFLSRIFTDVNGRQFRLTFLVAVVNGELRGHLISAEPISQASAFARLTGSVSSGGDTSVFCLPISCSTTKPATPYIPAFAPVISPYFSLEFLINSQPTRAPSF